MKRILLFIITSGLALFIGCNYFANQTAVSYYYLQGAKADKIKDYKTAMDYFTKAIAVDPKNPVGYYACGWDKYNLHDTLGALDEFNKVLSLQPNNAEAYGAKGFIQSAMNRQDSALTNLNIAIHLNPKGAYPYNNKSYIEYERHDTLHAFSDNQMSLKLDDSNSWAYVYRGIMKLEFHHDTDGALNDYDKALIMPNHYERAYYEKGLLLIKRGKQDFGCACLQKAKEEDYIDADKAIHLYCK